MSKLYIDFEEIIMESPLILFEMMNVSGGPI